MNLNEKQIGELKKKAAGFFSSRPEVLFALFFGSLAKGRGTPVSDLDFAVYIDKEKLARKTSQSAYDLCSELISQLMGLLKTNDVDLVLLNDAPPLLRHRILSQGEDLVVKDRLRAQRFFVKTLQDYCDTQPLRALQNKYLGEYIAQLKQPKVD